MRFFLSGGKEPGGRQEKYHKLRMAFFRFCAYNVIYRVRTIRERTQMRVLVSQSALSSVGLPHHALHNIGKIHTERQRLATINSNHKRKGG